MSSSNIFPKVAVGVGALLGSMYLDSKYLIGRDLHQLGCVAKTLFNFIRWGRQDKLNLYFRFKDKAKENPQKIFLVFEGREYTFAEMEKTSNKMAHWLTTENVQKGDIVCMMHQNHPTFVILLLAIMKLGAVPSLINHNLSDDSLFHCIKIADTKLFLFDPVYEQQVATVVDQCKDLYVKMVAYGESTFESRDRSSIPFAPVLNFSDLENFSDEDTSEEPLRGITPSDAAFLIYTSGTTGMPKAAITQHTRANTAITIYSAMTGLKKDERNYCVLPLYHSSGTVVSMWTTLQAGGTVVLGRKFSARRFWNDCVDYKVDSVTYIGEFCRYLLSQPPHPLERSHQVKLVYGNGMRPDVWNQFRDRFNIPNITEFYSATEAPASVFNINSGNFGSGAVGHRGSLFRRLRSELHIIKIDPITEEPLRGPDGYCIKCDYDEQGELIAVIQSDGPVLFSGYYKDNKATQKKILSDVFKKGDVYFRSGDLLKLDRDGFYYFDDRIGDTFRWKSENVATTEVAQALGTYPGIEEANVYGTLVPQHDGRAGMAAIVLKENHNIDFGHLHAYLESKLPKYAIPLFLRFVPSMEITGTFKQQKVLFRNQGIDLTQVSDPIYWLKDNTYVPFTLDEFAKIDKGKVKL